MANPARRCVRSPVECFQDDGRRGTLQRLFTTFPAGWPGVGLLVLRATAGLTIVVQAAAYLFDRRNLALGPRLFALLVIADGVCLLMGFFTPGASLLAAITTLGIVLSWFPVPAWNLLHLELAAAEMIAICAAIGFLGPGAFSLDARLFGWKEIRIPPASPDSRP